MVLVDVVFVFIHSWIRTIVWRLHGTRGDHSSSGSKRQDVGHALLKGLKGLKGLKQRKGLKIFQTYVYRFVVHGSQVLYFVCHVKHIVCGVEEPPVLGWKMELVGYVLEELI